MIAANAISLCRFFVLMKARDIAGALAILFFASFAMWLISLLLLKKAGKFRKTVSLMLVTAINFCAFFSISVYYLVPYSLFSPRFNEQAYNELQKVPDAEEINIETPGGNISGWLRKTQQGRAPLIIYYGGNGDNASDWIKRMPKRAAAKLAGRGNFVMVDYPGYGKSDGKPGDDTIREYSLAVYDAMSKRDDVDENKIILLGYSIGTGAAGYVASQRKPAGLILMAPYASGTDLINRFFPVFYGSLENLVSFRMPAAEYARKADVTALIFASPDDEIIGYNSSVKLSQAYDKCIFVKSEGLRHDDFMDDTAVIGRASQYIKEITEK